jgi:hypothetical protein
MQSLSLALPTWTEAKDSLTVDEKDHFEVKLMLDKETTCSLVVKQVHPLNLREKVPRIMLLPFLFLIGLLVLFSVVSLIQWKEIDQERCRTKGIESKWEDPHAKNEDLIGKNEEQYPLMKHGKKFGMYRGSAFDDSIAPGFKHGFYLKGFDIQDVTADLPTYEFYYTSDLSSTSSPPRSHDFDFLPRDRITRVKGFLFKETIPSANGTTLSTVVVTGLQFCSMGRIWSPGYHGLKIGESFSENFTNYTLGYIKGSKDKYLREIQFVWYRTG